LRSASRQAPGVDVNEEGVLVRRSPNRNARDSGQWGVSAKYMFDPLATEFGAYFMNYHSRAPIFSATGAPQSIYNGVAALPGHSGRWGHWWSRATRNTSSNTLKTFASTV
jgi:hypothetical protein